MGYTAGLFSLGKDRVPEERRLTAIMFTDLVGYTTVMGRDDVDARALVERSRAHIKRYVEEFHGQWLEEPGDATLSAFSSAINAADCALAIQDSLSGDAELQLRISLHLGDVVFADGHVYGDGVNVAARLEPLAKPGGILISETIRDAIRGHPEAKARYAGRKRLKNVAEPIRVYTLEDVFQSSRSPGKAAGTAVRPSLVKRSAFVLAGASLLGVLLWQGWHFYAGQEPGASSGPATLAVIPFVNVSGDPGQEYFSDGLTEELINALAGVEGLRVSGRTASFAFKGKQEQIGTIAEALQVKTVLEGSVRKAGEQVRISAQLVDAENGYVLWEDTFERALDDVFQVQSEIARAVADQLDIVMTVAADIAPRGQPTENIPAYNFYLQGLDYLRRPPSEANLDYAESLFREALKLDSDYARAYAGLCQVALGHYQLLNAPSFVDQGEESCRQALQLDESLDVVRVALGELYRETGRLEKAAAMHYKVLQSSPRNTDALVGLGRTLEAQNLPDAAEAAYRKAVVLQPGDWKSLMALGQFLYWQRRNDEAAGIFQRIIALAPDNHTALTLLASTFALAGKMETAETYYKRANNLTPSRSGFLNLGLIQNAQGEYEAAVETLRRAVALGPEDHWSSGALARALLRSGERQQAMQTFAQAASLARGLLQRSPGDWPSMGALATYLAYLGESEQALELVQEAMAGDPDNYEVTYQAAVVYATLERWEQALDNLEKAVAQGYPVALIGDGQLFERLFDNPRFQSLMAQID